MSRESFDEQELSKDPDLIEKLVESTAPNLVGLTEVKLAALYSIVTASNKAGISILLVGDPGTGKSHLLNWISELLNTEVIGWKPFTDEKGIILLENVNRLCVEEQRQLEYALRGKPASSVIATSRPFLGRYNPYQTLYSNIRLHSGVMGLFDLVFVLRDMPDPDRDQHVAMNILGNNADEPPISVDLLRRYLESARDINPRLSGDAVAVLSEYYLALRAQNSGDGAVPVTSWQLVSARKISEARAKLHHRSMVSACDAEAAIRLLNICLEQVGIDPIHKGYDVDVLYTGRPTVLNSKLLKVAEAFSELEKLSSPVSYSDIESILWERYGMTRNTVNRLMRSLVEEGFVIEVRGVGYKRGELGVDGA